MNNAKLRFARHIAWTSPAPAGLVVERAEGCRIWARPADAPPGSERDYLDLLAGIGVMNAGHSAPRVVAAISAQAQRYLHTMVYGEHLQAPQIALAEAVAVRAGGSLSTLYFTSSGAEAIEGSIKLARKATGRAKLVAAIGAYHGDTTGALSLGGDAAHRRPFEPLLPGVERIPFGAFDALGAIDRDTALVVVEPIQAEAGVVAPPAGWLAALRARCDAVGSLLAFDEVQTGFARTGAWFAFQRAGVIPDILVLAKALGGGLPLGAFAAAPELMATLRTDPPLSHLTTFGGNPLACAAGLAALEVLEEAGLPAAAEASGAYLAEQAVRALGGVRSGWVRSVRRAGLLIGLELDEPARPLIDACLKEGVIVGDALHAPSVVKLEPPLVIDRSTIEAAITRLACAARRRLADGG